jgi:hypothetical protein
MLVGLPPGQGAQPVAAPGGDGQVPASASLEPAACPIPDDAPVTNPDIAYPGNPGRRAAAVTAG